MKRLAIFLVTIYFMLSAHLVQADIIIQQNPGIWGVNPYGQRIQQRPQVQTGTDAFLKAFFAFQAMANSRQSACCGNSRVNYCDVSRQRVVCSNGYYSPTCMC